MTPYYERNEPMDAARGTAALGVVAYHIKHDLFIWYWGAMDFFFVMSSFLITRSLLNSNNLKHPLQVFLKRRMRKIIPPATIVIGAIFLFHEFGPMSNEHIERVSFLYYLTYTQNLDYLFDNLSFPRVTTLTHFWSLIIEEHYYCVVVLVFPFRRHFAKISIQESLVFIFLGLLVLNYARYKGVSWFTVFGRADGFIIGTWLALYTHEYCVHQWKCFKILIFVFAIGGVVSTSYLMFLSYSIEWTTLNDYLGYCGRRGYVTGFAAISCLIVLFLHEHRSVKIESILGRFAVWMGLISYELYLVHYPLIWIFKNYFDLPAYIEIFAMLGSTFMLAVALWFCCKKIMKMKIFKINAETSLPK